MGREGKIRGILELPAFPRFASVSVRVAIAVEIFFFFFFGAKDGVSSEFICIPSSSKTARRA